MRASILTFTEAFFQIVRKTMTEKGWRQFLARTVKQLGFGGIPAIAKAANAGRNMILRGIKEIEGGDEHKLGDRKRKPGGGRKTAHPGGCSGKGRRNYGPWQAGWFHCRNGNLCRSHDSKNAGEPHTGIHHGRGFEEDGAEAQQVDNTEGVAQAALFPPEELEACTGRQGKPAMV